MDRHPTLNTITLHRKKSTNTLYTINAMNELIRQNNNGRIDHNFKIDWDDYFNSILLLDNEGIVIIPTKLQDIVQLD